jgi:hypothetical protein
MALCKSFGLKGENMKKSRIITLQQLKDANACVAHIRFFKHTFGNSVKVTEESILKVYDKFDWNFAAEHFLSEKALAEYEKIKAPAYAEYKKINAAAYAEYKKIQASALAEYKKIEVPAFAEYKKIEASALAEYQKKIAPAWAEYEKIETSALAEYRKIEAAAWAKCYINDK